MNKEKFLKELEEKLSEYDNLDRKDLLNYYDEVILERIENGEEEEKVIASYDVQNIVNTIKAEVELKKAKKNPTFSNGMKALIAVLGICSLPILLPTIAVIFLMLLVILILIVCFVVTAAAITIAVIPFGIVAIGLFITGALPLVTALFILGITLFGLGISILLFSNLINIFKNFGKWAIEVASKIFKKRGGKDE